MFRCTRITVARVPSIPEEYRTWNGAGLVFTNGSLILCGYEPNKRFPAIYGIGGKRESTDTTFYHTAFREAFEELLGVAPPRGVTEQMCGAAHSKQIVSVGGYMMIQYDFADLVTFLRVLRTAGVDSPFYARFPRTVEELLVARRHSASTEMTHLCVLPVVSPAPKVSRDLGGDIERIVRSQNRVPQ
jgi:hypothetical protein